MKKLFWLLLLCALPCSGATIKLFTDYPNSTPVSSDFMLFQRNGTYFSSAQSQFLPVWFTDPVFTGNGSINGALNVGGTLTVGGAVITGVTYYGDGAGLSNVASQVYLKNLNDNGTNETFWDTVFNGTNVFQEIDAGNFYGTNFYTFITNAPFLKTDGDGKVEVGVELAGTNVLLSAGANIVFTTNGSGGIEIASNGTNTVDTVTNNLFVTTNVIIYSNLTVLQNIYASTNFSTNLYSSYNFSTNLYASTNFSTNLYFLSGKGNRLIITNNLNLDYLTASKLVATDGAKNLTNADVSADFTFSGNVLTLPTTGTPGTYGDGTHVAVVTVNSKGIATAVSSTLITGAAPSGSAGGVLSGTYPSPAFAYSTVTNGMAAATTISNQFRVDATHAFVASNSAPSKLASFDGANNLTNADAAARFTFTGNVLDLASVVSAGSSTKPAFDIYGRVTSSGTATLASSDFANQGTTTTLLHGNAAGNPSWASVANADLANSSITIQGSAVALGGTTLAAGSTPFFDLSSSTNLIYRYTTNALTAITMTFGKSYFTNVSTANIVFTAINAQDLAATETCILRCTNSSGSDWTVTLPNGIGSPGLGTPPVITVTNKQSCRIYVEHYGNQQTNAWFIPTY